MKKSKLTQIKDWLFENDEQGVSRLDVIIGGIVIIGGFILTALLIRCAK
jgi:hypothetical protein